MDGEVVEILDDLRRQLTCGCQHQGAGRAAGLVDQLVQNRQQESGRLAAAGRGTRQKVPPLHARWDRIGLNRRRSGEPEVFDALKKIGVELER